MVLILKKIGIRFINILKIQNIDLILIGQKNIMKIIMNNYNPISLFNLLQYFIIYSGTSTLYVSLFIVGRT